MATRGGAQGSVRLRLLAAEIRAERGRIERTVAELGSAAETLALPDASRLALYGGAALLETFYTGVEKALTRIAAATGSQPEGANWHRRLLDDATLDLPPVRPPVLGEPTARLLEPFLAFRQRLRNLYLFDLDARLVLPLLRDATAAWSATSADLDTFAAHLDAMAAALGDDGGP